MNVAVPRLQHSQWFGHLALSQTVCSFNSFRSVRVWAKLSVRGRVIRSHSGNLGRDLSSADFNPGMLSFEPLPEPGQLIGTKIRQNFTLGVQNGRQILT